MMHLSEVYFVNPWHMRHSTAKFTVNTPPWSLSPANAFLRALVVKTPWSVIRCQKWSVYPTKPNGRKEEINPEYPPMYSASQRRRGSQPYRVLTYCLSVCCWLTKALTPHELIHQSSYPWNQPRYECAASSNYLGCCQAILYSSPIRFVRIISLFDSVRRPACMLLLVHRYLDFGHPIWITWLMYMFQIGVCICDQRREDNNRLDLTAQWWPRGQLEQHHNHALFHYRSYPACHCCVMCTSHGPTTISSFSLPLSLKAHRIPGGCQ